MLFGYLSNLLETKNYFWSTLAIIWLPKFPYALENLVPDPSHRARQLRGKK